MKQFEYRLDARQVDWMFAPLRNKFDVIDLLMKTIKVMIVNDDLDSEQVFGKLYLCVSKMSRLFYISKHKYFSISFPFTVIEEDGDVKFYSKFNLEVDNRTTSDVIGILSSEVALASNEVMEFAEPICDVSEYNDGFWALFRDLLLFDDGYLRYDYDEGRENGKLHPLNHLDIFYSTKSTFKVGLRDEISNSHLFDLLDIESDCHFLDTV